MHATGQVIPDGVEVDRVFEPYGERRHGRLRVVPGPVEPAVDGTLDPAPERVEQGGGLAAIPATPGDAGVLAISREQAERICQG